MKLVSLPQAAAVALMSIGAFGLITAASGAAAAQRTPVTFARDIAPLVFGRCVRCHSPDGSAPFSLVSYADLRPRASLIATVTARRLMPPWKSEPGYGEFIGHERLSEAEIATIQQWVADGAPEGDTRDLPTVRWTKEWQLGTPDLVVKLPQPYTLRADGSDVWRIFVLPLPVSSMRYVRGLEFRPGHSKLVHHARIRIDRTPASRQLDEQDPAPGYEGLILPSAVYPDGHFLGWTPGQAGPLLPKGLAWRLHPGMHLVAEVHMVPTGKVEVVDPSIGLFLTDNPPERTPMILRLGRQNLDIPPGQKDYVSSDSFVVPVDVEVQAVQPHAHYRATTVRATATLPDKTTRPLIYIKDWDVRWQHLYQFVTPVLLPKGTTIAMQFTFDNSAENPRNPQQPPRRVFWGEESTSEMGELWIQVLTRDDRDLQALKAAIEPKMIAEDVVGYETRLRADPSKVQLHEKAADAYLYLGRPKEAVAHFEASLKGRPESAAAHYNLGIALTQAGDVNEAIAHFRRALEIRPDYAVAHNNLGTVLSQLGNQDQALHHFREAVRLDPANPDAHYNVGSLSHWCGELSNAIDHFRRAVELRPEWTVAVSNLAWLLATAPADQMRDPKEAVRLAERAADLTSRQDASVLDVLAAAYASAGEFQRAVTVADAALALKPSERIAAIIRLRQGLYKQRKPYLTTKP